MEKHRHEASCWRGYEPCGEHHAHSYNCGGGRLQPTCPVEAERLRRVAEADRQYKLANLVAINEWVQAAHANAREHGWWPSLELVDPDSLTTEEILSKIALMHSELSEAVEEVREGRLARYDRASVEVSYAGREPVQHGEVKPEGAVVELADVCIRIFDLCGALGLDLEGAIRAKHAYNQTRPFRHGGKKA